MIVDALVYDLEIRNAIPDGKPFIPGIKYCRGWNDKKGMGISVICAYDLLTQSSHVYLRDNFQDFYDLATTRAHIIGYNSKTFDDLVAKAQLIPVMTTYDLFRECRKAAGHNPDGRTAGYGLDNMSKANYLPCKSMKGAEAPIAWQQGKHGKVIDYCMGDVMNTYQILCRGLRGNLIDPTTGELLQLRTLLEGQFDGPQTKLFQ